MDKKHNKDDNLTDLEKAWAALTSYHEVLKICEAALTFSAKQSIIKEWGGRQDNVLGRVCLWWSDFRKIYEKDKTWNLWADLATCNLHYLFN